MWNEKKPWWQKKARNNQTDTNPKKTWCVIKVAVVGYRHNINTWDAEYTYQYKAVGRSNAPIYWTAEGKAVSSAVMENLTKHEAHCCAKGLNFFEN